MLVVDYDWLEAETDLAWGIRWDDIEDVIWFPKSQCEVDTGTKTLEVPEWLWEKKSEEHDL